MTDAVDVRAAARRLGVSRPEVYRLIATGQLEAHKFADRWLISAAALRRASLAPRPSGRPIAITAAWELLRLISLLEVSAEVSPSRRAQLRRHLRGDDERELAGRLRHRAARHPLFVHPAVMERLREDQRLLRSGEAALAEVGADLVAGSGREMEGYVLRRDVAGLVDTHDLLEGTGVDNVVLHVVPDSVAPPQRLGVAAPAVVALDLIESGNSRSVAAGWQLWRRELEQARRGT